MPKTCRPSTACEAFFSMPSTGDPIIDWAADDFRDTRVKRS